MIEKRILKQILLSLFTILNITYTKKYIEEQQGVAGSLCSVYH